jgi:hypothetical protein
MQNRISFLILVGGVITLVKFSEISVNFLDLMG